MSDAVLESAHDDLEAYTLGALDRDDESRFVDHLSACEPCRSGIVSYVSVTNALRSIPAVTPPPMPVVAPAVRRVAIHRRFAPVAFAYAAAAALLLVVGAAIYGFTQPNTDRQLMAVAGMMADGPRQASLVGEGVRGRVIIGRRNIRAAVVLRGLPNAPAGNAYHVWIVDSKPLLVGALSPARDNLEVLLTDKAKFGSGHAVRVSLEPIGATSPGTAVAAGTI